MARQTACKRLTKCSIHDVGVETRCLQKQVGKFGAHGAAISPTKIACDTASCGLQIVVLHVVYDGKIA